MATLREPFALDRSLNTTELSPRNLADVLAQSIQALTTVVSGLNFINAVVVEELPTVGISTTTIYLVPSDDPQSENVYDEYINLDGTSAGWEKIGSTEIDLSNYYTKTETDTLLSAKADTSDIPTVNDGTLTIQQNGETKGTFTANQSGNSTVNIETPTTDIQTAVDEFSTYNGGILNSLKVALSPTQDLHGFDHPWVGGAGKNKLPLVLADIKANNVTGTWNGNVYTKDGIDFTILTDDADNVLGINANGTATSQVGITLASSEPISAGSYILNGTASGSGWTTSWVNARVNTTNYNDIGSGASFTVSEASTMTAYCYIASGATISNKTFYPMIRLATESDPTFEPYSNICPISGHTEVDLYNVGKNRFDGIYQNAVLTGGTTYTSNVNGRTAIVSIKGGQTYTVKKSGGNRLFICESDSYPVIGNTYTNLFGDNVALEATVTPSNDAKYLLIYVAIDGTEPNMQVELGSTATPYVPYNGYQVTVNLGGTYYSGTLDVVSGELTVDSAFIASYNGESLPSTWISDRDVYAVGITPTTGAEVCYKLATPTSIQLSPTMVKALVGENHLSAPLDGQEITESKYKQMFTFDDVIAYIQSLS